MSDFPVVGPFSCPRPSKTSVCYSRSESDWEPDCAFIGTTARLLYASVVSRCAYELAKGHTAIINISPQDVLSLSSATRSSFILANPQYSSGRCPHGPTRVGPLSMMFLFMNLGVMDSTRTYLGEEADPAENPPNEENPMRRRQGMA